MKKFFPLLLILFYTHSYSQPACSWAYIPQGVNTTQNFVKGVAINQQDHIIQIGKLTGVADMNPDPGPGDTVFTNAGYNYYISKSDLSGHLIWIKYLRIIGNVFSFDFNGVKINSRNEIIVTGSYFGCVDFDLSDSGVDTLRSHFPTYPDYFVAKYDSAANLMWAFNIGDPTTSNIDIRTFSIQPNDDIIVAANPTGTVDVDPGPNVHNSIAINGNLICYDNNGNYKWNSNIATTYSYANANQSLAGDAAGNNYLLTVGYYELTVNKFDNNGTLLWDFTLGDFASGSRVNPQSLLVDKWNGDFYIAGTFDDTVDFDPGNAVVAKISSSINYQYGFIAKYDSSMHLLWVNSYEGEMDFGDYSLDYFMGDVAVIGKFKGTIDFGSGLTLTSYNNNFSPFYMMFGASGYTLNGYTLDGYGDYNTFNPIGGSSYVTSGYISGNIDMNPTSNMLTLSSQFSDNFTAVYSNSTVGINKVKGWEYFSVYPNPAAAEFTVRINENNKSGVVEIYSALGELLISKNVGSQTLINFDTREFESGVYLIRYISEGFAESKYIVVR